MDGWELCVWTLICRWAEAYGWMGERHGGGMVGCGQ
jgi:hypothetical protein